MQLYLVQHGEAKPKEADPDRPLTDDGRREVERTAAVLAKLGLSVDCIWHSGKTRADQTAQVLAAALAPSQGVVRRDGLAPNDPVKPVRKELASATADVMVVGHLPFLAKLASALLAGDKNAGVVAFRYGCVVCIARAADGSHALRWMLTPDLLP